MSAPAWLRVPLSSRSALETVTTTLGERERRRRQATAIARAASSTNHIQPTDQDGCGDSTVDDRVKRYNAVDAFKSVHRLKNRYGDIYPYDRTRVELARPLEPFRAIECPTDWYVNATLLREPDIAIPGVERRWWIAAQAAVPETSSLEPPNLIVQLTPLVENGRRKADPYFPAQPGQTARIDSSESELRPWFIRLDDKQERDGVRTSRLSLATSVDSLDDDSNTKKLTHVEYLGWGDHGVPDSSSHLASFVQSMLDLNVRLARDPSKPPPIVVGCSAGVGRTGTFITIASLLPLVRDTSLVDKFQGLDAIETQTGGVATQLGGPKLDLVSLARQHGVDPFDFVALTIDGLREQRVSMVERPSQVRFCYEALLAAWEASHD
ncbi:hypothetical protein OIV83_002513 [Microbotryomycetes sp. JL201]|nr:hypothetical protein OIV83_002513 [Microbotryomycetes sp. JL201]